MYMSAIPAHKLKEVLTRAKQSTVNKIQKTRFHFTVLHLNSFIVYLQNVLTFLHQNIQQKVFIIYLTLNKYINESNNRGLKQIGVKRI